MSVQPFYLLVCIGKTAREEAGRETQAEHAESANAATSEHKSTYERYT